LWPPLPQHIGEDPAKAQAPLADALVADGDPTRRQDQLNIAQAQTEAVIEPDGMLDDLAREAEAAIRILMKSSCCERCHGPASDAKLTMPALFLDIRNWSETRQGSTAAS
jgi:hypothetical protein